MAKCRIGLAPVVWTDVRTDPDYASFVIFVKLKLPHLYSNQITRKPVFVTSAETRKPQTR